MAKDIANLDTGLIKRRMSSIGMDCKTAARRIGVSPDMVRGWLNKGESSLENAVKLASILGLTLVDITVAG